MKDNKSKLMNRRDALKAMFFVAGGSVLAACGSKGTPAAASGLEQVTATGTAAPDMAATVVKAVNEQVAVPMNNRLNTVEAELVDVQNQQFADEDTATAEAANASETPVPNTAIPTNAATAVEAEATDADTPTPGAKETPMNGVEAYQIVETETHNGWTINWTDVAQKDMGKGKSFEQWAKATYPEWWKVEPEKWPTAPNVPNPLEPRFRVKQIVVDGKTVDTVPDGMEIVDSGVRNFCEVVAGEQCTVPIAAGAYFEYTGDGQIPGLWKSKDGMGNALVIANVGDKTSGLTGTFLQGWAEKDSRIFNGDTLPIGLVATVSHADNDMLNDKSKLNPNAGLPNAGANCSVREGCKTIHNTVIIMSGGATLLIADSEVSK
jgi:hypothetical protein